MNFHIEWPLVIMGMFFLLVGMAIIRFAVLGRLRTWRNAQNWIDTNCEIAEAEYKQDTEWIELDDGTSETRDCYP